MSFVILLTSYELSVAMVIRIQPSSAQMRAPRAAMVARNSARLLVYGCSSLMGPRDCRRNLSPRPSGLALLLGPILAAQRAPCPIASPLMCWSKQEPSAHKSLLSVGAERLIMRFDSIMGPRVPAEVAYFLSSVSSCTKRSRGCAVG
jgi:hypothetical protein